MILRALSPTATYPQQTNGTYVAVDLVLTDGSSLRDSGLVDQYGVRAHPQFQGQGGHLVVNRWNLVKVNLGGLAGRTVDRVDVGYDQPANTGQFRGYLDDISFVDSSRQAGSAAAVVNLALERPASGSAACAATETVDKAVDGTQEGNSKWCSGVAAVTSNVDGVTTSTAGPVTARYVRFVADTPNQNVDGATRVYEVSVYGS